MTLIRLHLTDGSELYLNPEHVVSLAEFQGGTKITTVECADEQFWNVREKLQDVVHAAIVADPDASRVVVPG
jgi:hypothetical protein